MEAVWHTGAEKGTTEALAKDSEAENGPSMMGVQADTQGHSCVLYKTSVLEKRGQESRLMSD